MMWSDRWQSVDFAVFEFVDVLPVLALALEAFADEQPVLAQLGVEVLVLALPPLLLGVPLQRGFPGAESVEEFPFLAPEVIEYALVRGHLEILVLLVLSEFREVVVDHGGRHFGSALPGASLCGSQVLLQRAYALLQRPNQLGLALHVLLYEVLVRPLLEGEFVELALVLGVDDVVLLGKRVLSEGLHVVRPEVPLFAVGQVFSGHEAFVVAHGKQH